MIDILIQIAFALDAKGLTKEADAIDDVMVKIAQYGGPYSMDLPIGSGIDGVQHGVRVIPWSEMEEEFHDFEYGHSGGDTYSRGGRKKFPRFYRQQIQLRGDNPAPGEGQGETQDAGPLWQESNSNPQNQQAQNSGQVPQSSQTRGTNYSIFDINGPGTGGITHMEYDIGPGMRGNPANVAQNFDFNRLRQVRPDYAKYVPTH